jgi:tRNA(Ile)-lysidine synthase
MAAPPRAEPLSDAEFDRRLAAFGPFEVAPRLAVAVSGGADSLALALLADRWARARGGSVTALTVDHGLRPESAAEAAQVGAWLTARGIGHHVVAWRGPKPSAGIQAAAREARFELLAGHCRAHAILHLLLAHQADDQAETFVLRLTAESGPDGLAGMSSVVELADLRLLRPLLGVPHDRLVATLTAAGQAWVEDPSNRNPRFARTALRPFTGGAAAALTAARGYACTRVAREAATAALLAQGTAVFPGGWVELDLAPLLAAPEDLARRALVRAVVTVGGLSYPPRGERTDGLVEAVRRGRLAGGRTLGGCRIVMRRGRLIVAREPAAMAAALPIEAPGTYIWDDRFVIRVAGRPPAGTRLRALGEAGWTALVSADKSLKRQPIPAVARLVLPALWDLDGVREVPHLSYRRQGGDPDSVGVVSAVFRPRHVLAGAGFASQ